MSIVCGTKGTLASMSRNVVRQEGKELRHFTTAVFDLIPLPANWRDGTPSKDDPFYYYRPWKTILTRTVNDGGQSSCFQGDHRQTLPTLWHHLVMPEEVPPPKMADKNESAQLSRFDA